MNLKVGRFHLRIRQHPKAVFPVEVSPNVQLTAIPMETMKMAKHAHTHVSNITQVEPQVPCVRLRGRINLNFSTIYAVDCGA